MNFREIAKLAQKSGYDMITVESMGPRTVVTCERRMSVIKETWVEEMDVNFNDIERTALEELTRAGLDARPSSVGIRAFGQQDDNVIDQGIRKAHAPRHAPDTGVANEFQPQGVHREGFSALPDRKPRGIWGEGATW